MMPELICLLILVILGLIIWLVCVTHDYYEARKAWDALKLYIEVKHPPNPGDKFKLDCPFMKKLDEAFYTVEENEE